MTILKAHFDGTSIVLDEPADLKPDMKLLVHVEHIREQPPGPNGETVDVFALFGNPIDMGVEDLAEQHDHYLYGLPKKQ